MLPGASNNRPQEELEEMLRKLRGCGASIRRPPARVVAALACCSCYPSAAPLVRLWAGEEVGERASPCATRPQAVAGPVLTAACLPLAQERRAAEHSRDGAVARTQARAHHAAGRHRGAPRGGRYAANTVRARTHKAACGYCTTEAAVRAAGRLGAGTNTNSRQAGAVGAIMDVVGGALLRSDSNNTASSSARLRREERQKQRCAPAARVAAASRWGDLGPRLLLTLLLLRAFRMAKGLATQGSMEREESSSEALRAQLAAAEKENRSLTMRLAFMNRLNSEQVRALLSPHCS
eukprot:scaffold3297_cov327-Prasinococcus_capsulatus_cf.AAC.6